MSRRATLVTLTATLTRFLAGLLAIAWGVAGSEKRTARSTASPKRKDEIRAKKCQSCRSYTDWELPQLEQTLLDVIPGIGQRMRG